MGLLQLGRSALTISPDATVMDAVRKMSEGKVGAIAVLEGPKLEGVFTERDLMRKVVFHGKDPKTTTVREVMSAPVFTVHDDTPLHEAVEMMRTHHIRHLAIVDAKGELAGMISQRYLLYRLMDDLQKKVGDLTGYLLADAPGG
jgi:CBS domain-containing protein